MTETTAALIKMSLLSVGEGGSEASESEYAGEEVDDLELVDAVGGGRCFVRMLV